MMQALLLVAQDMGKHLVLMTTMAIDGQGNIHHIVYLNNGVKITPTITAIQGTYDLRYNVSGTLLGAVRWQVDSNYFLYDHSGESLIPENTVSISKKSGKIYTVMSKISYTANHQLDYTQFRLCAFAPDGRLLWEDSLAGQTSPNNFNRIRDAVYDGNNAIYLSGEGNVNTLNLSGLRPSYPSSGVAPIDFIAKLDTNGKPL
ncbi:MAG: hypothetical protein ABI169_13120, partial [Chitinophagaceae bacterium]